MRGGLSPMLGPSMLHETMGFWAFKGFLGPLYLSLLVAPKFL